MARNYFELLKSRESRKFPNLILSLKQLGLSDSDIRFLEKAADTGIPFDSTMDIAPIIEILTNESFRELVYILYSEELKASE
jgi:hypothetical protein